LLVRWVIIGAVYLAVAAAINGIRAAFGQRADWSFPITFVIVLPLILAVAGKVGSGPEFWPRRRFPRLYRYLDGFAHKPDPRLSRFKSPESDD
jgi:hypothetical protein